MPFPVVAVAIRNAEAPWNEQPLNFRKTINQTEHLNFIDHNEALIPMTMGKSWSIVIC